MIRTLDRLRGELTPLDNLLVYFAGHGILDSETDTGFWLPVDAEEDTQANWIAITTITRTTRAMSAKHVMVVADSCYSGTLTRGVSVSVKTGAERTTELRRLAG
ncbi:MAG: caspase family protein, partial [Arenicellales bacterium]|nr:caspase family protein [Arenicellales bacterium]